MRQGDLLLVTQIPGEPLGRLMEALDGTRFSHSGIAVRVEPGDGPADHLASALATKLDDGLDFGGVRWDPFSELWHKHRDLYCIPMSDDLRARALAYLGKYRPHPKDEGKFSFVKLVTVAAALRAFEVEPRNPGYSEPLFSAACSVASAWAATDDEPAYYCAELVATAYGRPFTRAEMVPPAGSGIGEEFDEPWWIRKASALLSDTFGGVGGPRGESWVDLAGAVSTDWDFVAHAMGGSLRSVTFLARGKIEPPPKVPDCPLRAPAADHPSLARTDVPIPHALVTPRMLWQVWGQGTIRRIRRPDE
ncbi:hypothetical protein [Actinomycetospora aeridis]|uniref:Uncharacterized protein n=1 Tax=Actinomycetospora aeridis TaxID=3129231 RepID=A0ABU8N7R7_9PSEU